MRDEIMTSEEHEKILNEIDYKKFFGDKHHEMTATQYSAKQRQQIINDEHNMRLLHDAEYKKSYDEYMKEREIAYDEGMNIFYGATKNMKIFGK